MILDKIEPKTALLEIVQEFQKLQDEQNKLDGSSQRPGTAQKKWLSERRFAIFNALEELSRVVNILQHCKITLKVNTKEHPYQLFAVIPSYEKYEDQYVINCPDQFVELLAEGNTVSPSDIYEFGVWLDRVYSRAESQGQGETTWACLTNVDAEVEAAEVWGDLFMKGDYNED